MRLRHCPQITVLMLLCLSLVAGSAAAANIEAVQGKQYKLTNRHGPWMIMVASLYAASPDGTVRDGKTPTQIASELVYELRLRGIPAYTYSMEGIDGSIQTTDRLGRQEKRKFLTTRGQVCVIAGNYPSLNDPTAQKTLDYVKKLSPKCLGQQGVKLFKKKQQGPLSGAFLTINPLMSPEEVKARQHDPLLVKINSGGKYSLFENEGEYSLVVATFSGKSMAHLGNGHAPDAQQAFKIDVEDNDLAQAGHNAWELTVALREYENIDAYVWHDRYQSVVTVGSFESAEDPRLKRYLQVFAPAPITQVAAASDRVVFPGAPSRNFGVAAGGGNKVFGVTGFGKKGNESRLWAFDPNPMLMRVPKPR